MEMVFKTEGYFDEAYIPPRCRKPRYRDTKFAAAITIPVVPAEAAPVVFSHKEGYGENVYVKKYRRYNGRCYTRMKKDDGTAIRENGWMTVARFRERTLHDYRCRDIRDSSWHRIHDEETAKARAQALFSNVLILDMGNHKEVWKTEGEPMYEIATFGLGHNHGGSALMITNHYNPNVNNTRYFPANKLKEARAEALRIAKGRGDTESLHKIQHCRTITVYDDGAVTRNPKEDHGEGNDFLNFLDAVSSSADSAAEAGIIAIAGALASSR